MPSITLLITLLILCAVASWFMILRLFLSRKHRQPNFFGERVVDTPDITEPLIQTLPDPLMIVTHTIVSQANAAALRTFGAHIVGQDIRLAIRHPEASALLAHDAPDGTLEVSGVTDRKSLWELRAHSITPHIRVFQLVDRTARHAAEQARTDFVANASHELRTPLASILGFIETLSDGAAGGDARTRNRFLNVMQSEGVRMQQLIDDLISLSRIEAERYQTPQKRLNLNTLIRQAAQELRTPQGEPANILLDLDSNIPDIMGDKSQIQQLIHNLLGNALKYGRPNAPVQVSLHQETMQSLTMKVIDQGEGIPAEHIPRLTERFYRVDSARSRASGGTGLGLAIVKHIVERHRGRLDISSLLGVGTTVSVSFPV